MTSTTTVETARVYLAAEQVGNTPTIAVAEHFGIAKTVAAKRVGRAREAGLLPATSRGARGGRNPKVLAIAADLGVTYDALADAVRKHANGNLRIR